MHTFSVLLAVSATFIALVSGAITAVKENHGQSEQQVSLERHILPEGCVPISCYNQAAPPVSGKPATVQAGCTPKLLECTGEYWDRPDNKPVYISWGPDLINRPPVNIHKYAGVVPQTTMPVRQSHFARADIDNAPEPTEVVEERAEEDDDDYTVYVYGTSSVTVRAKPTPVNEKVEDDDYTVYVYGTSSVTIRAEPTPVNEKIEDDDYTVYVYGTSSVTVRAKPTPVNEKVEDDDYTVYVYGTSSVTIRAKPTGAVRRNAAAVQTVLATAPPVTVTRTPVVVQATYVGGQQQKDDDDYTVYVYGTSSVTIRAKPTAAVAERQVRVERPQDDDDYTVYVDGTSSVTIRAKPTAAVVKRQDDEEDVDVPLNSSSILYPPVPRVTTHPATPATTPRGPFTIQTLPPYPPIPGREAVGGGGPPVGGGEPNGILPPTTFKKEVRHQLAVREVV